MIDAVATYHDGTKHHFHRFARSLGYLDWASQPNPFRSFPGAAASPLHPRPDARPSAVGDLLRHALGLSAWKQYGDSRWALRVNPSSGNLHPTEAYAVCCDFDSGVAAGVYHYAPDRHELEQRCAFDAADANGAVPPDGSAWLIALTSVHWRESWKYGERAFRYCQHDIGHAIAAVSVAAALVGCRARLRPDWSHADIAALTGIDRDEDYVEAEREEPGCVIEITPQTHLPGPPGVVSREPLLAAVGKGRWTGRANQLSEDHVTWSFIDEVAAATRDARRSFPPVAERPRNASAPGLIPSALPEMRALLLRRRSAVSFDPRGSIDRSQFIAMVSFVTPARAEPFDAIWWEPRIHLALFVHRVNGLEPGLYVLPRDGAAADALRRAFGREFLWEEADGSLPLFLLARGDCRRLARRVSCDQDIASDGFFTVAMIAEFDASLAVFGASFYRHLFWESGFVGQMLYLAAEAAGVRGTGIGCFYDDPVHDVFGLRGHAFQSLYHFTVGTPVEDRRLTTEPGYQWER